MTATPRTHPAHAVVVGAGLHGLAAAYAAGHHLERVTLTERNDVPDRVAPGAARPDDRYARPLRRALDSPQVVLRAGLEAVAVAVPIAAGRVHSVEVCSRPVGATRPPPVTIEADLVVDGSGRGATWTRHRPDGLVVIGATTRLPGSPSVLTAELSAAVPGRCLAEHLRHQADLTGFSAAAQRAVARVAAVAPTAAR